MRGTATTIFLLIFLPRITPAHAGNRWPCRPKNHGYEDHPRPCGEQLEDYSRSVATQGSPPPMRGTGRTPYKRRNIYRITPAHAGNSPVANDHKAIFWDHPRPCGEQLYSRHYNKQNGGSPPPMRGTGPVVVSRYKSDRITPAHAGNSMWPLWPEDLQKDHPRPCGEQRRRLKMDTLELGSPPPMRGTAKNR